MDGLGPSLHHLPRRLHRVRLVDSQTGGAKTSPLQGIESRTLVPSRRNGSRWIRGHRRIQNDQRLFHLRETTHRRQAWRISSCLDNYALDTSSKPWSHGPPRQDLRESGSRWGETDDRERETCASTRRETIQNLRRVIGTNA